MSYRDPKQALEPAIEQIVAGIEAFHAAADERLKVRSEWSAEHLEEVEGLQTRLLAVKHTLQKLKEETW